MAEGNGSVPAQRDSQRRPHSRSGGVLARALIDAPVRLVNQLGDSALAAAGRALVLPEGTGGQARCEFARLSAAHAVRDREERRLDDVGVLVSTSLLARIGAVAELCDRAHRISFSQRLLRNNGSWTITFRTSARSRRRGRRHPA